MTCVQETTKDAKLEKCNIIGYLDGSCRGSPVQTQKMSNGNGCVFEGTADVQSFMVDCTAAS